MRSAPSVEIGVASNICFSRFKSALLTPRLISACVKHMNHIGVAELNSKGRRRHERFVVERALHAAKCVRFQSA